MRHAFSLRFRLAIFYLLIALVPSLLMTIAIPRYYQNSIGHERQTLTEGTLNSLARNIETYLDDLNRLTITPYLNEEMMRALSLKASGRFDDIDAYTRLTAERALNFPLYLQNTRQDILGIVLVTLDGSGLVTSMKEGQSVPDYPYADQEWYQKAVEANGRVAFIGSHPQDYLTSPTQRQVFSVARLIKEPDTQKPLAVIMADADSVVLDEIAGGADFGVSSIVCILTGDGQLLYASEPLSGELLQLAAEGTRNIELAGDSYAVISKFIPNAQWRIVVLLSNAEIIAQTRWFYLTGILFAAGGLILTFALFFVLSQWIVNPFEKMSAVMKQVQDGNLEARLAVVGHDEVAELGHALNHMIAQLDQLVEREYKALLNQRNAEYRALQSQIQPHFLYNTLNGFIGLNRLGDRQGLEKAILALSGMLRYVFGGQDWTRLEDEFLFVQRYCDLQRIRFQERLELSIHCDPVIKDFRVPKLLLQPLVENAINHGIEPLSQPCHLIVTASLQRHDHEARVRILVQDNGQGFDTSLLDVKGGLGIGNVQERLKMAYSEASFSIASQIGSGTRIEIKIPMRP